MNIVPRMMAITRRWEVAMLKPYLDGNRLSIGYGHGNANNHPPFVDANLTLKDEAEAMAILVSELEQFYAPQLTTLLNKIGFVGNDNECSALLEVGYNRGMGRLRDSLALRFLQHPELKWFKEWAAQALVYSDPLHFGSKSPASKTALDTVWHGEHVEPLDVNAKGETRLGLTLRRIDDASLFLTKGD